MQSYFQRFSKWPSLDWITEKNLDADPVAEKIYRRTLLIGLGIALLAFGGMKGLLFGDLITKQSPPLTTILALAIGACGWRLRASELTPAARIIYRTTAILFGLYLIASHVPIPLGAQFSRESWFLYGPWIGLVAAIVAFWRPSFALITYTCVFIHKHLTTQIWDISITKTDYTPVVESSAFLVLGIMAILWCREVIARQNKIAIERIEADRLPLLDALVIVVIGIHFANYFWSGIAKIRLDGGGFLGWPIHNPTHALFEIATDAGFFTIGWGFPFSDKVGGSLQVILPLVNYGTFITQLACIFVFWRRWAIVATTAIYDLQHVVIFLLTGIFFWKWIILNTALVIATHKIKFQRIPPSVGMLACLACVVIGFTGNLFFVARLGWYDTSSYNRLHVFAVTRDGGEYLVPSNFFGPLSVTMAQMRIPSDLPAGFPTGTWGSDWRYSMVERGLKCEQEIDSKPGPSAQGLKLERFTRLWHRAILAELDANGRLAYDWYPHHIWSNPRRYDDFKDLDKRKVVAYRWVRDAVCIDLNVQPARSHVVAHFEKVVRVDNQ